MLENDIIDEIEIRNHHAMIVESMKDELQVMTSGESDKQRVFEIKEELLYYGNKYGTNIRIGYESSHDVNFNIRSANEASDGILASIWNAITRLFKMLFGGGSGGSSESDNTDNITDKALKRINKNIIDIEKSKIKSFTLSVDETNRLINRAPTLFNKNRIIINRLNGLKTDVSDAIIGLSKFMNSATIADIDFGDTFTINSSYELNGSTPSFNPDSEHPILFGLKDTITMHVKKLEKTIQTHISTYTPKSIHQVNKGLTIDIKLLLKLVAMNRTTTLFRGDLVSDLVSDGREIVDDRKDGKKRKRLSDILKTMKVLDKRINQERITFVEFVESIVDEIHGSLPETP
jgi:hypothetical protein